MPLSFSTALLRRVPPWLQRAVGGALVRGLGDPIDALAARTAESIKARFPDADRPDALAAIGTERRIPRGPDEPAATYAGRLAIWLDSHRTRGGAYALLGQLFGYWRYTLNVPIEVVAASGGRESMDTSGAITHDIVAWTGGGDLSTFWAQDWIFFHTPASLDVTLVADTGDELIAGNGDTIIASIALASLGGVMPASLVDTFTLVPRTWAPAHLKRCTIVLLYGTGIVYGYPVPCATYGDGHVYGANPPVFIVIDF